MMTVKCSKCRKPTETPTGFPSAGYGRLRPWCKKCERKRVDALRARGLCGGKLKVDPLPVPRQPIKKKAPRAKTYVITWAQNATPVHEPFLKTLEAYCKHNDATLLVIPGRYKNPTSIWSDKMEHDEWWFEELHPYLFNGRKLLGENICVFGDISIQPTAKRPLTDFEVFVGKFSGVFGHPRLQFKTVPTAHREYPRILTTTGAVTIQNYTDSKAGKKGEAHHVIGACVVEEDEGLYHIRQINAKDDGSFIDVDTEYKDNGEGLGVSIEPAAPALALICGDIHESCSVQKVLDATLYAPDSILKVTRAEKAIYHDVLHFDTRGHHNINDFMDRYDRCVHEERLDSVEVECQHAVRFLDRTPEGVEHFVVAANHDEAFDKWLKTADPRQDPKNARFFHEIWAELLAKRDETGVWVPAFELYYNMFTSSGRAKFLRRDDPLTIAGIECGFHGDLGPNGSWGSPEAYAKLGVKTVTGHTHQPAILDGAYVAGVTGDLDQRYNRLPSSWLYTHVIIYANGKRGLISVIDGKWRARKKAA